MRPRSNSSPKKNSSQYSMVSGSNTNTNGEDVIFRVRIQSSLKKMVDLPPMSIWNRLQSPESLLRARLSLHTRTKGLFFHKESDEMWRQCLLSEKGYLIIYAKESALKGYALNIAHAKKVKFSCSKFQTKKSNSSRCPSQMQNSVVTIKWGFGSVCLTLPIFGTDRWRQTILNCFTGSPQCGSPPADLSSASSPTINTGNCSDQKKDVSPACSMTQIPSKTDSSETCNHDEAQGEPPMHDAVPTEDKQSYSPQAFKMENQSNYAAEPPQDDATHDADMEPRMHGALTPFTQAQLDLHNMDASGSPQVDFPSDAQLILTVTAQILITQQQYQMIRLFFEEQEQKESPASQKNDESSE